MKRPNVGAHGALPEVASWSGVSDPYGCCLLARSGALEWPHLLHIVVNVALVGGNVRLVVVVLPAFGVARRATVLVLVRVITTPGGISVVIRAPMSAGGAGVTADHASQPHCSAALQSRREAKLASLDPREHCPAVVNLLGGLVSMSPLGRHAAAPSDPVVARLARRMARLSASGSCKWHACLERAVFVAYHARAGNPALGATLPPTHQAGGALTDGNHHLGGRGRAGFAGLLLD